MNVDRIEILDGNSGEFKIYENKDHIISLLESIKDETFTLDSEQAEHDGFRYLVELYEGEKHRMAFSPSRFKNKNYVTNESLTISIRQFFEGTTE